MATMAEVKNPNIYLCSVHPNSYKSYAVVGLLINRVCRNYDL